MNTIELSGKVVEYIERRAAEDNMSVEEVLESIFERGLESLEQQLAGNKLVVQIKLVDDTQDEGAA